jgi:glycosyltransferase involved in cell wall biosynthesis
MKVLWFTGIPMPEMLGRANAQHAAGCGWIIALRERLAQFPGIELSVACMAPGLEDKIIYGDHGVTFYTLSQHPSWRYISPFGHDADKRLLDRCARLIDKISPDIVHVHGTERFHGLMGARGLCRVPMVISMQGLEHQYSKPRAYFGVTPWRNILEISRPAHLPRDIVRLLRYVQSRAAGTRELEILRGNHWFMGRTLWDRACLEAVNPKAKYFHVSELLRADFLSAQWDLAHCQRHRIIFTNANAFRRGNEVLIEAIAILKKEFDDVTLAVAGADAHRGYGHKMMRTASRFGVAGSVETLGYINARQMIDEFYRAHVFAIASFAENSPNSLCEAQLAGMPCVASYAGGIPSLVEDGATGFLFPPGDAAVLAKRIKDIFLNDDLASTLGKNARQMALKRHDPAAVTACVIETYHAVIADAKRNSRESHYDGSYRK